MLSGGDEGAALAPQRSPSPPSPLPRFTPFVLVLVSFPRWGGPYGADMHGQAQEWFFFHSGEARATVFTGDSTLGPSTFGRDTTVFPDNYMAVPPYRLSLPKRDEAPPLTPAAPPRQAPTPAPPPPPPPPQSAQAEKTLQKMVKKFEPKKTLPKNPNKKKQPKETSRR